MAKEKQILRLYADGLSQRQIAAMLGVSRNTVSAVLQAWKNSGKTQEQLEALNDQAVFELLFPEKAAAPIQVPPDFEHIHKELLRSGVTLRLLWEEYVDACHMAGKAPYMYSQYCQLYADYVDRNRLTMHIRHKPGDKVMVDWAGTKLQIYDESEARYRPCYLFAATLPFSMYCYAEAFLTMKQADWIAAHVHMYEFFGASSRLLVCDNLKTGVIRHARHEDPVFNRSYQEMADHYKTALLPARVLSPKDKAAVEGSVGALTSRIIAKLRDKRFFSLDELNRAIWRELKAFNAIPFQKREGSRDSVYHEEELAFMQPLPAFRYEPAEWKTATVQMNYHIACGGQYYSVPYAYVKKKVDVKVTENLVEIFYQGGRICSHRRLRGKKGQYSTNTDHMPLNHQLYGEWNRDRFIRWAAQVGPSAKTVIERIFESYRVEEQAYRGCLSLLKLADKYSPERLEDACRAALEHIPSPRYKNIRLILEAGNDRTRHISSGPSEKDAVKRYTHLRGAAYYGGGQDE